MESSDTTQTKVSLGNNIEKPADLPVSNENQERCQSCRERKDPPGKSRIYIFSLIMIASGAALLYFGFKVETRADSGGKGYGEIGRDRKIITLTLGFTFAILGVSIFLRSILMFKSEDRLYEDDSSKEDEEFSTSRSTSKK